MKILILSFFIIIGFISNSQTIEKFQTPGSYTWTCPPNVTQVKVQCWGTGGGGGNSANSIYYGGQGGGGGAFSESTINVTPNQTYYLFVGTGGIGAPKNSSNNATSGQDTWFNYINSKPNIINNLEVLAAGGGYGRNKGDSYTNYGSSNLGIGKIIYSGGSGATGTSIQGGGGGGGACDNSNGRFGSGLTGGSSCGKGGNGSNNTNSNGVNGSSPGGGGGGSDNSKTSGGGNGGDGQIILTYTPNCTSTKTPVVPYMNPSSSCGSFTLLATNVIPDLGLLYQWQMSLDSLNWKNLPNYNNLTYNHTITEIKSYYRLITKCIYVSNDSTISKVITHVLDPNYLKTGTISEDQVICRGDQINDIFLTGSKGTFQWQVSSNKTTWNNISNATDTFLTSSKVGILTSTKYYRSVISNTTCGTIYSDTLSIKVFEPSNAGSIVGNQIICSGKEFSQIILNNSIADNYIWQYSSDTNWYNIPAANSNFVLQSMIDTLKMTTNFRAIVSNGVCKKDTSSIINIRVDNPSIAGILTSNQVICSGSTPNNLTLNKFTGSIQWQYSNDLIVWKNINLYDSILLNKFINNVNTNFTNIIGYYRANVRNGACPTVFSNAISVTINPKTFAGNVSSSQTICQTNFPSPLKLSSQVGDTIEWQYSTDQNNWKTIKNSNSTTLASNVIGLLDSTTFFRTKVYSGACQPAYSIPQKITVDLISLSGNILNNQTICKNSKPSDIFISNYRGNKFDWYYATPSSILTNKWTLYTSYSNDTLTSTKIGTLTEDRYFKVIVFNGTCGGITSSIDTVRVSPISVAGNISSNQTICSGTKPLDLKISGNVGNIQWQKSTDNSNWFDINNATNAILNSDQMGILTTQTYYRAKVVSSPCSEVYTSIMTISIIPLSDGGVVSSNQSICVGSSATGLNVTNNIGTIQWQTSLDSIQFSDLVNETSSSLKIGFPTNSKFYRVKAKNNICAENYSNIVKILVSPKSTTGTLTSNQTICSGSYPTSLNVINTIGTVTWQSSLNNSTWSTIPNVSGTTLNGNSIGQLSSSKYFRAVVKSGACSGVNSNSIYIGIRSNPIVSAGSNKSICPNTSITLSGSGASTYSWSNGITNGFPFTPTNTTTYSVIGTDIYGCKGNSQVTITVYPQPTVQISNNNSGIICQGTPFTLSSSTNNVSYFQWKLNGNNLSGETNNTLISKNAGNYSLEVQSINGCKAESNPIIIQTQELNFIDAGTNQTICLGDKIKLDATCQTFVDWGKNFKNGDIIFPSKDTLLIASTTDQNGCQNSDTLSVKVNYPNNSILNTTSYGSFDLNGILYENTGQYTQTLKNSNGCDSTITLNLVVEILGVNVNKIKGIKVYPNPTSDGIIQIESDYVLKTIKMYNSDGKLLENINGKSIDLSRFGRGVYFITFLNENSHHFKYKIVY